MEVDSIVQKVPSVFFSTAIAGGSLKDGGSKVICLIQYLSEL